MKVALYYPWLYVKGGIEKVILETITRSRHDWTIFTNHYDPQNTYGEFGNYSIVELNKIPVTRDFFSVIRASYVIAKQKLNLEDYDLLFIHSDGVGDFCTLQNSSKPVLGFCHTPLRIFFDTEYKRQYLETHNRASRMFLCVASFPYKVLARRAWSRYRKVLTNSAEVRKRITSGKLIGEEKIQILHPGIDYRATAANGDYQNYFLAPGRIVWTKNLELAINSFFKFRGISDSIGSRFRLIIAGSLHPRNNEYYQKLKALADKLPGSIEFKINIPDDEYYSLYRNCYAVLFTPLNEDWGMVPIEAMSFGKPVLAVNSGGPKESVIDGQTGFLCSPESEDFAKKLSLLANDIQLTKYMGQEGRRVAKKYDWKYFVEQIDHEIDQVTGVASQPVTVR